MRAILITTLALALCGARAQAMPIVISGGGETMLIGGSGGTQPLPVKTNFVLHIVKDGDQVNGSFECLALGPSAPSGPGSGMFTENIMYVSGKVTSVSNLTKSSAAFTGTANVTGIGAGVNLPFDCLVESTSAVPSAVKANGVGVSAGGSGAHMTLNVSGLTFDEIVTLGGISITPLKGKK